MSYGWWMTTAKARRERFLAWMANEKLNVSKIAKAASVPATTLYDYVRGDTLSLRGDTEAKIALAFNCDVGAIFGTTLSGPAESQVRRIPVVGFVGAASEYFGFDDHAMGAGLDTLDVPAWVPDGGVAVIVRGDSGYPAIKDGMVLVYWDRHDDPSDLVGEDCFVRVADGRTLVKTLERGSRPGLYTLASVNASTPPIRDVALAWAAPIEMRIRKQNWLPNG